MTRPDYEGWACFAAVADHGGFTRAAAVLGMSKSAVSKAVTRLEIGLGITLFHRSSRSVTLSVAGAGLLAEAQAMVAAAEAATEAARADRAELSGPVRLTAPMSFGIRQLGEPLADFLALHPAVEVDVVLSDARVDVVAEGFDFALRIADLPDSSLLVRNIAPVPRSLVASPAYLARHGVPTHPLDLAKHRLLGYGHRERTVALHFVRGREQATIVPSGPLFANNGDIMLPLLVAGEGAAMLPDFIAGEALADGRLVRLLPDWPFAPSSLSIVSPPSRLRPARVEALIAHLSATLKDRCASRDSR